MYVCIYTYSHIHICYKNGVCPLRMNPCWTKAQGNISMCLTVWQREKSSQCFQEWFLTPATLCHLGLGTLREEVICCREDKRNNALWRIRSIARPLFSICSYPLLENKLHLEMIFEIVLRTL